MSELSKQALKVDNNQSFPNNNAGLITPSALRTFNENMIDSTVNQQVYTADSASFDSRINAITGSGGTTDTGSLLTTASFDNGTRNLTFTKGDSSTFNVNIPDVSGSVLPSGVVSGSSQIILQSTTGNLSGSRIDGLVTSASFATTASFALNAVIETGSFATTGSNVFIGNQTITGSLLISGSEVVTGPLTASRLQINGITDLNGTLDVSNDATFRGNVIIQSSGEQKLLMRSTSGGGVSQGFDLLIQTSSFIIRDETHGIDFLEFDYISSSADHILKLEANRFEMNSGSLGISGSLTASLQQGYAWVGDSSGRTQAIPTSSFGGGTIDTGSFATTGSNTFTSQQIINSNDGIILRTNDGTSTGEVRITPGTNPPTKFTPSTLSGIEQIDALKLSGSWGQVGDGAPAVGATSGVGLYNHRTGSNERLTLSTSTYTPFQANNSGAVQITGNTIGLVSSSSLGTTSVQVTGDVSASVFTGSFVGDGSGVVGIVSSSYAVTASFALNSQTIDTGSFATTGSNTFVGDQTINGGNHLSIQRATTGANQILRLGPTDNGQTFEFIVTGSDVNPGQQVWNLDVQGGVWQNSFLPRVNFSNLVTSRAGFNIVWQGGVTPAGSRLGTNHTSESVQVYTGLSSDGHYIVSSSVDERIIDVNPTTATVAIGNTISSQIFLNPQTLTGTQTVPSGFNGMITGPVSNAGTIVIESGSTLVII